MSQSAQATSILLSPRYLLYSAAWLLALFGTLQLHELEGTLGHAICGPWGCGPPLAALLGYHAFWLVLLVPLAVIANRFRCAVTVRYLGLGLCLFAVAGIAALLLLEGLDNSAAERYPLRWSLFRVATFVEFPLVQLGVVGFWLYLANRRAVNCHLPQAATDNDPADTAHG